MKKILLIHGPNLNKLGTRQPEIYGSMTLADIESLVSKTAASMYAVVETFQSNHEGALIDFIQAHSKEASAIIINPGALTHTSYALHDAIIDSCLPTVEVHLSNLKEREAWRANSVIAPACTTTIMGKKADGYLEALHVLMTILNNEH